MKISDILESSKQIKNHTSRKAEYPRVRLDGLDVRMHVAVKATGKNAKELRNLKNLPRKERLEKEKNLAQKVREFKNKRKEVDHQNGNKDDNNPKNLKLMSKGKHSSKTGCER